MIELMLRDDDSHIPYVERVRHAFVARPIARAITTFAGRLL